MRNVRQGGLLKVSGLSHSVIVVSNIFINRSDKAIVCPILKDAVMSMFDFQAL